MEGLLSMIEGAASSNEISSVEEIDHPTIKEFLNKLTTWDFYQMSKDEFVSKSELEKQKLIIKYYNECISGINLLFVVCCLVSVSGILSSMIRLSPVSSGLIITGLNSTMFVFVSEIIRFLYDSISLWLATGLSLSCPLVD